MLGTDDDGFPNVPVAVRPIWFTESFCTISTFDLVPENDVCSLIVVSNVKADGSISDTIKVSFIDWFPLLSSALIK